MNTDDINNSEEAPINDERDVSPILDSWALEPGTVTARRIVGTDGQEQIQLRIPMGLLQVYPDGRPDGIRPEEHESVLAQLRDLAESQGQTLNSEHWYELDREIMQFYHRRIALLSIAEGERREGGKEQKEQAAVDYARVVRDADHNLEIMDFIKRHNQDTDFAEAHEQYRTFVMGHRTLGTAQYWLCRDEPEEALNALQAGMDRLRKAYDERSDAEVMRRDPTVSRLTRLMEQIRKDHSIAQTLHEELSAAIQAEEFEKAAAVRDRIRQRMVALKAPFRP